MNYSINKLDAPITPGAKPSIVAVGVRARAGGGGKGGEGNAKLYCVCHVKRYCSRTQSNEDHF